MGYCKSVLRFRVPSVDLVINAVFKTLWHTNYLPEKIASTTVILNVKDLNKIALPMVS